MTLLLSERDQQEISAGIYAVSRGKKDIID